MSAGDPDASPEPSEPRESPRSGEAIASVGEEGRPGAAVTARPSLAAPARAVSAGPSDPATPAIPPPGRRLPGLDTLRGLAILGIVPANLPSFAMPSSVTDRSIHFFSSAPSEAVAEGLHQGLIAFKFVTIFALLYGAGLRMQWDSRVRSEPYGLTRTLYFVRRLGLLAAIGLIHGTLLWYGDILLTYGAIGLLSLLFVVKVPTVMRGVLGALGTLFPVAVLVLFGLTLGAGGVASTPPSRLAELRAAPDSAAARRSEDGVTPPLLDQIEVFQSGTYVEQLEVRIRNWCALMLAVVFLYGFRVFGLILLGAALYESGFLLAPREHPRVAAAVVGVGLLVGLPVELWRAVVVVSTPEPAIATRLLIDAPHQLSATLVSLAYITLVMSLPERLHEGLLSPVRAVGRMALSCYLLTTVIGILLFRAPFLALYAKLTRLEILLTALAICPLLMLVAWSWLKVFRYGPVEWVWRSLSELELRPLRR